MCLVQSFMVKDALPGLTHLHLHNACEVLDSKAYLKKLQGLQVSFDTVHKAYHGQWWDQLKQLRTKCPCHVALGVAGHFPEVLESLTLLASSSEPVTVTTGVMTNMPKPYPHQASPCIANTQLCKHGSTLT